MNESKDKDFGGLEAKSLFCPNCGQARAVERKLLLVLPQGDKIAYFCKTCGAKLASKTQPSPPDKGYNLT
jgi:hypothetical protein